ncbi:MAG: ATP-binding protein [Candidatus Hodarchaeales archaeon]
MIDTLTRYCQSLVDTFIYQETYIPNMEQILKRYNPWWTEDFKSKGILRKKHLEKMSRLHKTKDVVFIIGLRRVGKTTLIHQFIKQLLNGIDPKKIVYFSMDHPRLTKVSILDVLDEFRKIQGLSFKEKIYAFIDEVHLHENFEQELKVIYDMGNVKVFASGSTSIFLIEKGAFLTGRQRFIELTPFSFREFLKIREIEIKQGDEHLYLKYCDEYIKLGGLPEYIRTEDQEYITTLIDSIIHKDVAGRHSLTNIGLLKDMIVLLSQGVGGRMSTRKIGRVLGISHETVRDYINFFVEANLLHLVEKDGKASERKVALRKIYIADNGIANVLTPTVNTGSLVENMVFNILKSKLDVRYDIVDTKEIDFVTKDCVYEVKYKVEIDEDEIKHLKKIKDKKKKIVITYNLSKKTKSIEFIPLYKFILEQQ